MSRFILAIGVVVGWLSANPAAATPFGPIPTMEILGPGCQSGYAVVAGGTLRMTFQNVAHSCAGQRCTVIVDEPLDGRTVTVKHDEIVLAGTFKKNGEMCGKRAVWTYSLPVPEAGKIFLLAKGAPTMSYHIKAGVDGMRVLDYGDFGPQAAAHKLLGQDWWQWQAQGDVDPEAEHDVKVVVYRGVPLGEVKQLFPVDAEKGADFRYVTMADAMAYLDLEIKEDVVPRLTRRLRTTRRVLESRFGKAVSK